MVVNLTTECQILFGPSPRFIPTALVVNNPFSTQIQISSANTSVYFQNGNQLTQIGQWQYPNSECWYNETIIIPPSGRFMSNATLCVEILPLTTAEIEVFLEILILGNALLQQLEQLLLTYLIIH